LADNRRNKFSNARLPKLRVFVCWDLTTEGTEEHRVEVHEELQKMLKHSTQKNLCLPLCPLW
jgi:hypothetical protein